MVEPDADAPLFVQDCDKEQGYTWCAFKQGCVQDWVGGQNGPCQPFDDNAQPLTALNGFAVAD